MTDSLAHAFTDEVATGFLGAVAAELAPTGLALTLLTSSAARGELVPARDVPMDGALVYSCDSDSAALDWLRAAACRWCSSTRTPVPGAPSVNVDDRGGARAAAAAPGRPRSPPGRHRHRRAGRPARRRAGRRSASDHHVSRQRMLGWTDALHAAGSSRSWCASRSSPRTAATQAARVLLDRRPADRGALLLRRHRLLGVRGRRGPRAARARRRLRRRVRRQPAGPADAPGADHRAPGRRRQGPGCGRGADRGHRPRPAGHADHPGPARPAADRAGRAGQHAAPPVPPPG